MDPILAPLVGLMFAVVALGMALGRLGQPLLLGYLLIGIAVGPSGLGLIEDQTAIARLGEFGVVLLLFFAGMHVSLPDLASQWRVPILGTLMQIVFSVGAAWGIGQLFDWPFPRSLLLGFVISLSSTAVVLKMLHDRGEMEQPVGRDVVGIILAQDLAVIPMLIVIAALGGDAPSVSTIALQVFGGACAIGLLAFIARRDRIDLPLARWLGDDHELHVFAALALCFGLALLTGLAGLSVALGAFLAGIVLGAAKETEWVHDALFPFQVIFLAVFFVSVGMMLDLEFIVQRWVQVGAILLAVLATNTLINMLLLRALGRTWGNSLYGGALLSQIGEFSFVLAAVGLQVGLIERYAYQMTVAVIALSLLASSPWIALGRRLHARMNEARLPAAGEYPANH